MTGKKENNRILALLEALNQGREQFQAMKASSWESLGEGSAKGAPAFAVNEIYDLREDPGRDGSAGEEGEQMDIFRMAGSGLLGTAESGVSGEANRIAAGDNLEYMAWLLREKDMAGKIQMIYVDPPFFTNAKYQSSVQITGRDGKKSPVLKVGAYEDTWGSDLKRYLQMLAVRFFIMRELLSDTGCLWVHLDWHGSHYVKMMLDEIFGHEQFVNEVAWTYKSGGASKRSFARKHDTLLFYSKTKEYKFHPLKEKSYNRDFKPYRFQGVEEFKDEIGWYTMVNMKDVWNIDMVGRTSAERMGYATQKPEKLLQRIVDACTDPGDLCADFFAGTGTLGAVCAERGRPWILCDEGDAAIGSQILRMAGKNAFFLVERPVLPYEVRPVARAQVEVKGQNDDTAEAVFLRSYQPDLTQIQEADRQIVTEYISENSLDLISFWSLDEEYDGREHRADRLLPPEKVAKLSQRGEAHWPREETISIVGYDIFGGRFTWTPQEG